MMIYEENYLELPTTFDERFKLIWVKCSVPSDNLLSCKLDHLRWYNELVYTYIIV